MKVSFDLSKKGMQVFSIVIFLVLGSWAVWATQTATSGVSHNGAEVLVSVNNGPDQGLNAVLSAMNNSIAQKGEPLFIEAKAPIAPASDSYTAIPESTIIDYCGDIDGCEFRIAMVNYDSTGRATSRPGMIFYNETTKQWRSSLLGLDHVGKNVDGVLQHLVTDSWDCYLTDATYTPTGPANSVDSTPEFGLVSHAGTYRADCRLFIYD